MKRTIPLALLAVIGATPLRIHGQYCVPTTAVPYASTMPGITLVQVNTIFRTSQDLEHYPNNNYTLTGLTTTLTKGETYPITIGFTLDATISPHMNLRIWVDLNQDGQLDDPGETLYSIDHVSTTQTGNITVPPTAMTGATRMRVTAKMCSHGGHSLPTPCDQPADILGYHGEIEDYEVDIVDAVGVDERNDDRPWVTIAPVPATSASQLRFKFPNATELMVQVLDALGRDIALIRSLRPGTGDSSIPLHTVIGQPGPGTYWIRVSDGVRTTGTRFVLQ